MRLLARREHSRAELARKLAPHAGSAQELQTLLDSLIEKKQLSDERYASERARWLARKYGPARIRHDLRAKGVAAIFSADMPLDTVVDEIRRLLA